MWSLIDIQMMSRAIKLARKGYYTTSPNPCVGCVITKNNHIVGEGYHQKAGEAHAEVNALAMAKNNAAGATAYVTLEPCSHFGRTPPCANALIDANVAKVVIAMVDPNPEVSGRGIYLLKKAGIDVVVGLLEKEATMLNQGFIKRMKTRFPLVTIKLAASLDGKTALANGESKWITSIEARQDVQRLRAHSGALVTGIDTVLADNPTLNVRYQELGFLTQDIDEKNLLQPMRVVLDSHARLRAENASALFEFTSPILLVSCQPYPSSEMINWPDHIQTLQVSKVDNHVNLVELLMFLGKSINHVLIEAGATLAGAFMSQGLADELVLYQAPKILGNQGQNLINLPTYQKMNEIPSLTKLDERSIGRDKKYIFSLR